MFWLIFAGLGAVLEWWGEYRKWKLLIYITKPLALSAIILWVVTYSQLPNLLGRAETFPLLWFVVGLFFCLLGDIFLMLPPEKYFAPGLAVFLMGHVFYILGFGTILPPRAAIVPGLLIAGVVLALLSMVYPKLARGLTQLGKNRLKGPVGVYAVIISVMLYAALTTLLRAEWHYFAAWAASLGAVSFYFSDIMNAWTRFVAPIPLDRPKIMITYHLGQILLAVGATMHYLSL